MTQLAAAPAPSLPGQIMFVVIVAGCLALPIALALLALYRRAVSRAMAAGGAGPAPESEERRGMPVGAPSGVPPTLVALASASEVPLGTAAARLHEALVRSPWRLAAVYVAAGVAYAVVMAVMVLVAHDTAASPMRVAMLTVDFAWPIVLAVSLVAAQTRRHRVAVCATYAAVFAAVAAVAVASSPALTWIQPLVLWAILNVLATLLLLLFLVRRVRAVGPLVLAFTTFAAAGAQLAFLTAASSDRLLRAWVTLTHGIGLSGDAMFPALLGVGGVLLGVVGWFALRWLGDRYARGRVSDLAVTLDSVWLVYAFTHGADLALAGAEWLLGAVAAFVAYKTVAAAGLRILARRRPAVVAADHPPTLLLLRVFALGRRSEQLFDPVTAHWRHVGPMRLIAGPDLATSTVEPHEFLDFVSGNLARHFIDGVAALESRFGDGGATRDADGRYRVAEYFCRVHMWKAVLARLAKSSDAVLMDLRGFSPASAGCVYELGALVDTVPLSRVLLVVDPSTDEAFLDATLADAWRAAPVGSPNRGGARTVRMLRTDRGRSADVALLLRAISDAASSPRASAPDLPVPLVPSGSVAQPMYRPADLTR